MTSQRSWLRLASSFFAIGIVIASLFAFPQRPAEAALAAPAESACVLTCQNVPATAQAAAQELLNNYNHGTFVVEWAERAIIPSEIQPIANGTISSSPQCNIDLRTLQTLVIIIRNYGSLQTSDLNRHCANDTVATCPSNPTSRHCVPASGPSAMDITYIGGARTRGNDASSAILLSFLDSFLPSGSRAGQASGGSGCGVYAMPSLRNISRFTDSCTHIHIDLGASTAPLRNLTTR
jgi:hypothetical protein